VHIGDLILSEAQAEELGRRFHSPSSEKISSFRGDHSYLSNFSPHGFVDDRMLMWPTSEHYYQAMKSVLPEFREEVRLAETPALAKSMGAGARLRDDWEEVRLLVMHRAISFKFDQNILARRSLIMTAGKTLVEGNTWGDTFWGVCGGRGLNHLGRLLMRLRDTYISAILRPINTG
jgi:N-glycosidase YbiA